MGSGRRPGVAFAMTARRGCVRNEKTVKLAIFFEKTSVDGHDADNKRGGESHGVSTTLQLTTSFSFT